MISAEVGLTVGVELRNQLLQNRFCPYIEVLPEVPLKKIYLE